MKLKRIRKVIHIYMLLGIVWSMMNLNFVRCEAKELFTKQMPKGLLASAVDDKIVVSWEKIPEATGYHIYEKNMSIKDSNYVRVASVKKTSYIGKKRIEGTTYCYYVRGYKKKKNENWEYSKKSQCSVTTVPPKGHSTIKNFLTVALAPVGATMYVWGGGWNKADTGAGKEARQIGVSPTWRKFAKNKTASYDYRNYRYQIQNGLDCSGYVGWSVYNIFHTKNGKKGYVYSASKQAKQFSKLGFGKYVLANKVKDYKAGDIMSSTCYCCGHVWIVLGQCKDKSVVLLHASPAGVQINGTISPEGNQKSEAILLARRYMKKYYPEWYQRYPKVDRGSSYLSHYGQMRWKTTGNSAVLSDPDGYLEMSAEEILKDIFQES